MYGRGEEGSAAGYAVSGSIGQADASGEISGGTYALRGGFRTSPGAAGGFVWNGGGADNNWTTTANWSGNVAPGAADTAIVNVTSDKNIVFTAPVIVGGLSVGSGYDGIINPGGFDLTINGDFSQANGTFSGGSGAINVNGDFTLAGGSFTSTSGQLRVAGNFSRTGGTFAHNNGAVVFDGAAAQSLTGGGVTFYGLTSANSGAAGMVDASGMSSWTVSNNLLAQSGVFKGAAAYNNVQINSGATLELSGSVTIDGALANNGALRERKNVTTLILTEFLHIKNSGGVSVYHGVDITADGPMGVTTVDVRGSQSAGCTTNSGDALMFRCFDVTPAVPQNSLLKFWFTGAEQNGQAANALKIWHYDGPRFGWSQVGAPYTYSESGTACPRGRECWVEGYNISGYSPFGLGSGGTPTAVTLRDFSGGTHFPSASHLLATLLGALMLAAAGLALALRRSRRW